jgi:2-dehydro-3-deoxyphosphogluconate aldolase/(4S)-4-hydroxy-2-oxoglutarate aldolase
MSVLERLRSAVVVAVVRAPDRDSALAGIDALVAGGIRAVEVTYSTPDAAALITSLRGDLGDEVVLGAGTITTAAQAAESAEAGAEFLVSPGTTEPVAFAMRETGLPFALGTLTPSEVMTAVALGAHVVKLFPGSLGGPAYLKSLREPFPDVPLMPTGGVRPGNVREWLEAGAFCVGAGGSLMPTDLLARGDHDEITRRAQAFVAAAAPPT